MTSWQYQLVLLVELPLSLAHGPVVGAVRGPDHMGVIDEDGDSFPLQS